MTSVQWILWTLLLVAGAYVLSVLEYWCTWGKLEVSRPLSAFLSLLGKEDIVPRKHDTVFFEAAPPLFIVAALLGASVLPLGKDWIVINLATGALFINAALAYVMVAMLMAGWAPNGVYAMVGGWRFLAQLIAYSMPIVMTITATVMRAESMLLTEIVVSQENLWNIIYQPVGFVLFYLSAMALAFLPPFDLPVSRGELAGGVWAEYTGSRLLIFRLGRLLLVFTLSLSVTVLFLGGWYGPWLPGIFWTLIKTFLVAASFFGISRWAVRIRHDDLLVWSWKIATPAALFNILWVGILLLL